MKLIKSLYSEAYTVGGSWLLQDKQPPQEQKEGHVYYRLQGRRQNWVYKEENDSRKAGERF